MDSKENLVSNCDILCTTSEARKYLEMCTPAVKIEIKKELESIAEEESTCSSYKNTYKTSESSKYVNYYDSKSCILEQLKKEIPDNECLQSDCSMSSKIGFEDTDLLTPINRQKVVIGNKEKGLLLNLREKNECEKYQVTIKIERLEEQGVLDNVGNTSMHYDVLITPQEVNCKLCGRNFENSFNLIKHNSEHIKVEINRTDNNEMNKFHQRQSCDKCYDNFDDMLSHAVHVHSKTQFNGKVCRKQFKNVSVIAVDKLENSPNQVNGISVNCKYCNVDCKNVHVLYSHMESCHTVNKKTKYKCDLCKRFYISKQTLRMHTRKAHYDYGRMFECWCGEQFPTPMHLSDHKRAQHDTNRENKVYKCKYCEMVYKVKSNLTHHMKKVHYDYERIFECWCGKQFPTPIHLREHKYWHVAGKSKRANRGKFQCDSCKKKFTTKRYLQRHVNNIHRGCSKECECCGKQFLSLGQLNNHKSGEHNSNINNTNNDEFQCDSYEKTSKTKSELAEHTKIVHNDNVNAIECWCGKQFSSSTQLNEHKSLQHVCNINDINNTQFQCNSCPKFFTSKRNLIVHTKRIHYEYDRAFKCWCGKEFRTPKHLTEHKRRHPDGNNINNAYNQKFQCDYCQILIKSKRCLLRHIKNIHFNKAKAFEYRCRKEYSDSKSSQRDGNSKDTSIDKFQCDYCQKMFKYKRYLVRHIRSSHYDYGNKMFKCWCGKRYRTPLHLYDHRIKQHKLGNAKCDSSQKKLKSEHILISHIENIHHDHGKVIECWCGKQFRSPKRLLEHKRRQHKGNIKDTNETISNETFATDFSK